MGVSWAGYGVAFLGCSRGFLVGTVLPWRILGPCCHCFLPAAAVVVTLMLLGCVLLFPSCLWFLGFGRVFWVVSPAPELGKPPGNIINSYEMCITGNSRAMLS